MAMTLVMALSWHMEMKAEATQPALASDPSDLIVSLITCFPGPEIYELCGHSALRVRGEGIDSVWNYGIFDFNQPNFVYRFVKGETDYRGAAYPFRWFLPEYIESGRRVVEQDLNLTPEEAAAMLALLRESVKPENAVYRYNYIKDNCSTRILNKMDSASSREIIFPRGAGYGTYRNEMRAYHKGYPWYQFGIDVALGSGLDQPTGVREEMFVPVEMMNDLAEAKFSDSTPLVKATRVLNQGSDSAVLPPTPWLLAPLFWSWLLCLIVLAVVALSIMKGRLYPGLYTAWFFILGLAGCLVAFLVFVSVHESSSPNVLILWLNPFQWIFAAAVLIRGMRIMGVAMAWYNTLVVGILLVISPFLTQSFNPAFYPLMIATVALGLGYAINHTKTSYKKR